MSQQNPAIYAQAIQAQLKSIFGEEFPVYQNFNRQEFLEAETGFVTWQLRAVHQPVYTGQNQNNKGIDTPVFQISIFHVDSDVALTLTNDLLQSLHGYSGLFGGLIEVAKADVYMHYATYDNDLGLQQISLDCTLYIST